MAYGTFTLTGEVLIPGGAPASGKVKIESVPRTLVDSAGNKVWVSPKTVVLDTLGKFSIVLPTDSTSGDSANIGWRVTLDPKHTGEQSPTEFYAPAAGATLDLADVVPQVVVPITGSAVSTTTFAAFQSGLDGKYAQGVHVTSTGAVGNGTTDDTAAIHAARDAAAAFGAPVYFPAGNYKGASLALSVAGQAWNLAPGATITGAGGSTHGVTISGVGASLRGGKVVGGGTTGACVTVNTGATGVSVVGVELTGATYGVRGGGTTSAVLTGLAVRDCYIHDTTNHGIFINGGADNGSVSGNRIVAPTGNGVYVGDGSHGLRCTGNTVTNGTRMGVEVVASAGVVVANNSVSSVTSYGVSISGSSNATVSGNRINAAGTAGMEIAGSSRCTLSGNTILSPTFSGIQINCGAGNIADGNVISGNTIEGPGAVGIHAQGSSTGAARGGVIVGNVIRNPVTQGIFLASTIAAPDWTISGNYISFTTTAYAGIVVQQDYTSITGNTIYYDAAIATSAGPGISLSSGVGGKVVGNTVDGNGKCTNGLSTGTGVTKSFISGNTMVGTTTATINVAATDANATNQVTGNYTDPTSGSDLILAAGVLAFGNRRRSETFTRTDSATKFVGNVGFYGATPIAKRATTADATDLASVIALANALKADLVAYGLKS